MSGVIGGFRSEIASGALANLLKNKTPAEAQKQLAENTNGLTNLERLQFLLANVDMLQRPDGANSAEVIGVAGQVLAQLAQPNDFVDLLARILRTDPKSLANLVSGRLANGVYVAKDEFALRGANAAVERKALTADELASLRNIAKELRALGLAEAAATAKAFIERYTAIATTSEVVFEPKSIPALYKEHGPHILGHLRRPLRLTVLPNTPGADAVRKFGHLTESVLSELDRFGLATTTSVMGDFADEGVSGALYRAAERHADIERNGVCDATIATRTPAYVDRATIFGTAERDAQPLFDDLAAGSMLMVVAPTDDDIRRVQQHCRQGGVAVVMQEGDTRDARLDIRGVLEVSLDQPVSEVAVTVAQYVRAKMDERTQTAFVSTAEHLAIGKAPTEINEIKQWARRESVRYRFVRLLNAGYDKLAKAHPEASAGQLAKWSLEFARAIVAHTHGIDNFKNNPEWQKQARAALATCSPEIATLAPQLQVDVLYASWFGIQDLAEPPSFFDQNVKDLELPEALERLSTKAEHTFDKTKYADVRLGFAPQFLNARDSRPEIFLGSREEMMMYYRAKGYEFDVRAHESNNTDFNLFRSIDSSKPAVMVLHGIDSEARMLQMAAMMRVAGVDPRRCIVRGTMERVRDSNCSLLENRLMELTSNGDRQLEIAAVVVGNRKECIEAIAEAAGVDVSKLEVIDAPAGPFRIRAVKVKLPGSPDDAPPALFLAFAPAYGQLTEDLGKVIRRVTSRQERVYVLPSGVGGSLDANDEVGAVHTVVDYVYGEQTFTLDDKPGRPPHLALNRLPDVASRDAVNVFSPTPLEQDQGWLGATLKRIGGFGKPGNTDQEGGALIAGLAYDDPRRPAGSCVYQIAPMLIQSDIVGSGGLASSTTDEVCGAKAKQVAAAFLRAAGLAAVETKGGAFAALSTAKAVNTAGTSVRPTFGTASVDGSLPKTDTQIAGWKSSAEQFKGQKVPYRIVAERFGPAEEKFLRAMLTTINPADVWIVVDAADPYNATIRDNAKRYDGAAAPNSRRVRDIAEQYGFETIVMALDSEQPSIRGHADFLLSYGSERGTPDKPGKLDVIERLAADGNGDEDPSYAISRTIVLGAVAPPTPSPDVPFEVTNQLLGRFVDILDQIHESIGAPEKDPAKKAALQRAARPDVLEQLAARCQAELPEIMTGDAATTVNKLFDAAVSRAKSRHVVYTGGLDGEGTRRAVDEMRRDLQMAFDGGVQMFSDGLTYRFPGLRRAISRRATELVGRGTLKLPPPRTGEAQMTTPRFYGLEALEPFFKVAGTERYRKPILISGPSRLAWDNIARDGRVALHTMVEVLAKLCAGEKDNIALVTGGTKYGLEEIFHEVFSREGWHILGTLSQNSSVTADKWEPDERLWHLCFPGVNWYGIARPVAQHILLRYGGTALNFFGGAIAGEQIAAELALNVDAWQMTGLPASDKAIDALRAKKQAKADKAAGGKAPPVAITDQEKRWAAGASVEMAERYPARGFETLEVLAERLGVAKQLEAAKHKLGIGGSIRIADIAGLAQGLGIDTDAIEKRYPA